MFYREGDNCKSHDLSSAPKKVENESALDPDTNTQQVEKASKPIGESGTPKTKQVLCKYYAKGCCWGGNKCTFLHERPTKKSASKGDKSKQNGDRGDDKRASPQKKNAQPWPSQDSKKSTKVCHFFKSGNCKKGDGCHFRHPGYLKNDDDDAATPTSGSEEATKSESSKASDDKESVDTAQELDATQKDEAPATCNTGQEDASPDDSSSNSERIPFERPVIDARTSMKMAEVTDVGIKQMRETEIKQFKIKFPEAELQESERVETYKIIVNPTDPDWVSQHCKIV